MRQHSESPSHRGLLGRLVLQTVVRAVREQSAVTMSGGGVAWDDAVVCVFWKCFVFTMWICLIFCSLPQCLARSSLFCLSFPLPSMLFGILLNVIFLSHFILSTSDNWVLLMLFQHEATLGFTSILNNGLGLFGLTLTKSLFWLFLSFFYCFVSWSMQWDVLNQPF